MLKEKTSAQVNAERAWRETLMYFVGYRSSFNVKDIAERLTHIEFNKDGDMIERGRAYGYLKKHFPSLFPVWRVRMVRLNGEDETRIHRNTQPSKGGNRKNTKKGNDKTLRKNPGAKHSATVHSG